MKRKILLLVPLLSVAAASFGQGPGSGGPKPGGQPTAVPVDGGASLLLAGGVAYALGHLRKRRA